MDFHELVKKRQSDRKYLPLAVEREKLERCLEAARLAPSASNGQPWRFVVVDEPELVSKVAQETYGPMMSFNKFVPQAPVIIAIVMENMRVITQLGAHMKNKEYALFDIGIAAEHFCLQAADEGLGTCMLGWFKEKAIKQLLEIPSNKRLSLLITVGYPPNDYRTRDKKRKSWDEVVSYNKY